MINKIDYDAEGVFDLGSALIDDALRRTILDCVEIQKDRAQKALESFKPCAESSFEVSAERLNQILQSGSDIHGIASDRHISNVISFSARHIQGSVIDEAVEARRVEVDKKIMTLVRGLFDGNSGLSITTSGHLWYPPGSYMGWHTNSKVPGWRIYVNYAEDEGRSFFRYRDPRGKSIVTLDDKHWNIRLFRIRNDIPLWHAVYSDTNRFSMGYMVYKRSLLARLKGRIKRVFG